MPLFRRYLYPTILFIHIPKTGGSSLENYFSKKYKQDLNFSTLFGKNNFKFLLKTSVTLQHLTFNQISMIKPCVSFSKIITIVRNPYDRIISELFFSKFINKNTTCSEIAAIIKNLFYIYQFDNDILDNHIRPQYEFILNNNKNVLINNLIILNTENLTEQMHELGYTDFENTNNVNKQMNKNKYIQYLNKDSINLINQFYMQDFEIFNYTMIQ